MPTYLKEAVSAQQVSAGRQDVSDTVREIVADIRARGDEAVREY